MNAAVAQTKTANLFDSGYGLQITYSVTSFQGSPEFTYHDASQSKLFKGDDQIRTTKTEVGTLVSVVINETPDVGSTTFTLLVPRVNLRSSDSAQIETDGITTLHALHVAALGLQPLRPQGGCKTRRLHAGWLSYP